MRTRLGILAMLATVAVLAPANAQQTTQRDGRAATDSTRQKSSTQTGQQNTTRNVNRTATNATNPTARQRQVTTTSTLADQPQRSRENPREKSALDPIALDSNLRLGLETSTKVNTYQFGDGRRVPGLENTTRNEPSYFGLSLSTPTNGVIPLPSLPRLD